MAEYTDEMREAETALVLIGEHGSTTSTDEPWERWKWVMRDSAPDFLGRDSLQGADPWDCMTVLDFGLNGDPEAPIGWRLVYRCGAGERECPWCGPGTGDDDDGKSPEERRPDCKLCEGDGVLYWGEECQICVFAPIDVDATLAELRTKVSERLDRCPVAQLFAALDAALTAGADLPKAWNA
jgi:hypothetical protein